MYFLITETKGETSRIGIDKERYQNISSVREWWLHTSQDSSINHDPLLKNYPEENEERSTVSTERNVLDDSSHDKSLTREINDVGVDPFSKSRSFIEHIKDVVRDPAKAFIEEEGPNNNSNCSKLMKDLDEMRDNTKPWWEQNLLLFVELIGVFGTIQQYKSGRIVSEVKKTNCF